MTRNHILQVRAINSIRFLSADAVQNANSGHPGLPMGCAVIAYVIWTRYLRHNPRDPHWFNRDRFILSGGHGSALLYSLLYLTGYDLSLEDIMNFRQWGSKTPGHPEYGLTPGVEVTTGSLGQGFANGVGMAIAEAHLAEEFNQAGYEIIDHNIYALVTDGDMMEGVTAEAASLAGHLRLGKLIYFYDDNKISIDGPTDLTFTEDCKIRFGAYGWQVLQVNDGNDIDAIDNAIQQAKVDPRPSILFCKTHIGFGLPTKQDTSQAHGEPPGDEELNAAKIRLGWPVEPRFFVPDDVLEHLRGAVERGKALESEWESRLKEYQDAFPEKARELMRRMNNELPADWEKDLPLFAASENGVPTRAASGEAINALANNIPELIGGSADLTASTRTWIKGSQDLQAGKYIGRNIYFGVREHAMGAIINGLAVHGGMIPFGSSFFVFVDYMRPAVRMAAMSHYPSIWIFTHDSIGVGEDGPTHHPVEHLASLRAIPNLVVIRPADANETIAAWKVAIKRRKGPTILVLTRQDVPVIDRNLYASAEGLERGAYVLADLGAGKPELILIASGSEVDLIVKAGMNLLSKGINVRLVSFSSWELFAEQLKEYQESVFPDSISARLAVEAGVSMGWERWIGGNGDILAMDCYGASAPYKELFNRFGFSVENVVEKALRLIKIKHNNCA